MYFFLILLALSHPRGQGGGPSPAASSWPCTLPPSMTVKTLIFYFFRQVADVTVQWDVHTGSLIRPQFTFNTDRLPHHTLYVPLNAHTPTCRGEWGSARPSVSFCVVNRLSSCWEDHLSQPVMSPEWSSSSSSMEGAVWDWLVLWVLLAGPT